MRVRITYQRRDETTPRALELSPDEYFDPLDEGEVLSVRSVSIHQDAFAYTGHRSEELWWTVLEITDGRASWHVRTQLLDGLRSLMTHSREADGSEEIIHQTELRPQCWHTIRTLREPGRMWTVVMNSLTVEQPGLLDESQDFCAGWSFEQLKGFGDMDRPGAPPDAAN
jgi:hypothetical protein